MKIRGPLISQDISDNDLPVQTPESHCFRAGQSCGCSGGAVYEGKLPEAVTLGDRDNFDVVNEDVHLTLVDHVKVVTVVSLLDNFLSKRL